MTWLLFLTEPVVLQGSGQLPGKLGQLQRCCKRNLQLVTGLYWCRSSGFCRTEHRQGQTGTLKTPFLFSGIVRVLCVHFSGCNLLRCVFPKSTSRFYLLFNFYGQNRLKTVKPGFCTFISILKEPLSYFYRNSYGNAHLCRKPTSTLIMSPN